MKTKMDTMLRSNSSQCQSLVQLSAAEYDVVVHDLTNFLAYVSEPAQLSRTMWGILTLLFLLVFFGFAYALSKGVLEGYTLRNLTA